MGEKNPTAQIILGIDPGTRVTGYGVIKTESPSPTPLDFGCIRPPPHLDISEKYLILFNSIETLMDTYCPHAVAIETQFVYKNVQRGHDPLIFA